MNPEQNNLRPADRRAGETSKAYAAFLKYLSLGIDRSALKAYIAATGKSTAQRAPLWERWCSGNDWVKRAADYDAEEHAAKLEKHLRQKTELEEQRSQYEIKAQADNEALSREMRSFMSKAMQAPVTDITQEKQETVDGKLQRTITRVKGVDLSGLAAVSRECREIARESINGVRGPNADAAGIEPRSALTWTRLRDTARKAAEERKAA